MGMDMAYTTVSNSSAVLACEDRSFATKKSKTNPRYMEINYNCVGTQLGPASETKNSGSNSGSNCPMLITCH